uniref:Mediator of RNA polymerase II transcription subunit 27 n=1 Tax=Suricata suricatta TaxID=37032 RepID=A0A673VIL2_SURSU
MADVLSVGVNLEAFAQAISAIQALRSSVSRVFDCLKDGMRNKETLEGREKAFIAHFQDNLHSVNRDLNELERLSNLVGKPSENHPLHNSGLLSLDPVQDKTPLYSQLLQAYKWSNKEPPLAASPLLRLRSPATQWCHLTPSPAWVSLLRSRPMCHSTCQTSARGGSEARETGVRN